MRGRRALSALAAAVALTTAAPASHAASWRIREAWPNAEMAATHNLIGATSVPFPGSACDPSGGELNQFWIPALDPGHGATGHWSRVGWCTRDAPPGAWDFETFGGGFERYRGIGYVDVPRERFVFTATVYAAGGTLPEIIDEADLPAIFEPVVTSYRYESALATGEILCFYSVAGSAFTACDRAPAEGAAFLPWSTYRVHAAIDTSAFTVPTLHVQSPPPGECGSPCVREAIWLCRACLAVYGEPGAYHDGMVRWAGTNPTFQFDYYYWYPKR